ncbi:MAG: hypothetical protein CMB78_00860 [Euryarchaeota archaeon]|nr:hypothetical protein [Euryarchaeota archaeon]|tara:strand:- start:1454 stop:2104 length:651 start_codon:yes stop_codon:yes gene_type:complete
MKNLKLKKIIKKVKYQSGASLAEFAVVTAMMATFVGTSLPKFSDVMELSKQRKTIEELDKMIIQGMNFYNETVKMEGRGRFPGQDKYNMAVGGYVDIDSLVADLKLFKVANDSVISPKWVSVFGINNEKAPVRLGAGFIDDILEIENCSNCNPHRFPGHEEWITLFANETLISPYQDGHYIYVVIPGKGSGFDAKSPTLIVADAENPSVLYKIFNI